jgi:hypothetical protein
MAYSRMVAEEDDTVFYDNKYGTLKYLNDDLNTATVVFKTKVEGSSKIKSKYFKSFYISDFENWNSADKCWNM